MTNTLTQTDEILVRVRESSLFYLKLDFGFIAGLATLVTLAKMEPEQILATASEFHILIKCLSLLIVFAIFIEYNITNIRNLISMHLIKENNLALIQKAVNFIYFIQATAHMALLTYVSGFLSGYLLGFSSV